MSNIYDVESLYLESDEGQTASAAAVAALAVSVDAPVEITSIVMGVEGPQGPPGLPNVFVSETDPSKDIDGNTVWGEEQRNYVWIQVIPDVI